MSKAFYKDALGALLIFDLTKKESLENIRTVWIPQLKQFGHENIFCLLGMLESLLLQSIILT